MRELLLPTLVIIADTPQALVNLGGISLLERVRRIAINLGFTQAIILSNAAERIVAEVAAQTWRADRLSIQYHPKHNAATIDDVRKVCAARNLVISADAFYDKRLIRALLQAPHDCMLIDSDPPEAIAALLPKQSDTSWVSGAALISSGWLSRKDPAAEIRGEIAADLSAGRLAAVNAAEQPSYIPSMRRHVRPCFFPAPSGRAEELVPSADKSNHELAERFLRNNIQKGVLDFPARAHAPIENWLVSKICRTAITPNQITLATALLGLSVTGLYATGHLLVGVLLALIIGVLDGIDGKLARLREQTTRIGKAEHAFDYCIEMSWWAALAFHFQSAGQLPRANWLWLGFFISDVIDRLAKWVVERKFGRKLDDLAPFDRFIRNIAGRRNVYTWLFAASALTGHASAGFVLLCLWGITSAAIHILRAAQVRLAI